MRKLILAINGGSSSLKAALFEVPANPHRIASIQVQRLGTADAMLTARFEGQSPHSQTIPAQTHEAALDAVLNFLGSLRASIAAVGHRIVHGGPSYCTSQAVTPDLLEALRKLAPFDPEHLPAQVRLIEKLQHTLPHIPQIACFDTAFHHDLPTAARRLPIPRKFDALGVRRYGFHGISYSYLMHELRKIDAAEAQGRIVLAHLGNGASLAAVHNGRCIDTSMSFTPAAGIPMGTRSGDLDPGLISFLVQTAGITVEQFNRMIHLESGLLGISETTPDMQKLQELESADTRAAEAVEIFCYHVRQRIGAYAAALGGLDTLIFAGGIGEHASEIRAQICASLRFLGIDLDQKRNRANAALISSGALPVQVRVMTTDEELMIASDVARIVQNVTG